ncbi:MAG TPA: hypothetical protein VI893_10365 [Thermoplasmata archaeon]|nr:hypothetical protein [Thermoplasmata archaeon]
MVSEIEIVGLVLGILGLGFAAYQIYLEFDRRKKERREKGVAGGGGGLSSAGVSRHLPEAAPLPPRETHLRQRVPASYREWSSHDVLPGPAGSAALATTLKPGERLQGEIVSLDGRRFHLHVFDEENYGLWRDKEPFDQLHGAAGVERRTFEVQAPAEGEIVTALHFEAGARGARVRLKVEPPLRVRVRRKEKGPGL